MVASNIDYKIVYHYLNIFHAPNPYTREKFTALRDLELLIYFYKPSLISNKDFTKCQNLKITLLHNYSKKDNLKTVYQGGGATHLHSKQKQNISTLYVQCFYNTTTPLLKEHIKIN